MYKPIDRPDEPEEEEENLRERPDDPTHYRNHHPVPAYQALNDLLDKFRNLSWIPRGDDKSRGGVSKGLG